MGIPALTVISQELTRRGSIKHVLAKSATWKVLATLNLAGWMRRLSAHHIGEASRSQGEHITRRLCAEIRGEVMSLLDLLVLV